MWNQTLPGHNKTVTLGLKNSFLFCLFIEQLVFTSSVRRIALRIFETFCLGKRKINWNQIWNAFKFQYEACIIGLWIPGIFYYCHCDFLACCQLNFQTLSDGCVTKFGQIVCVTYLRYSLEIEQLAYIGGATT